jgi:type I site-specific restriction-modification system R (restriction) subunit
LKKINLPPFEQRLKETEGKTQIFDEFRKKYVQLTPEEWVRQHFLHFLVEHKSYPKGLLLVESELIIDGHKRRPDLVVYSKEGKPRMIVEFKASSIEIDEDVFFQIAMYNKKLKVPFLILSNGMEHYCAKINLSTGEIEFLKDFPEFADL